MANGNEHGRRERDLVLVNASGHEVRMESLSSYHAVRAAEAARLAAELDSEFAANLAVEHAAEAAHAAHAEGRV